MIQKFNTKEVSIRMIKEKRSSLTKEEQKELDKSGFFNGEVYSLLKYKKLKNKLQLTCELRHFFELVANKKDISILNVNALICVNINNEPHVLLIKRSKEVFDYPDCWDLPAGFAVYPKDLLERLYDRIYKDTEIKEKDLSIKDKILIYPRKNTCGLYYFFEYKGNINKFVNNTIKDKIILLPIKNIKQFTKQNKCYDFIKHINKKLL